jgi:ketosteroid isomerase-like protein
VAVEDDVRAALVALDDAFARRELDAVRDLCTEDVLFIGSGDGEEAIGRDAIGPMFAELGSRVGPIEFSLDWESIDVDVLGDVALLVAWGNGRLKTEQRDEAFRYRLTGVLIRSGQRWL